MSRGHENYDAQPVALRESLATNVMLVPGAMSTPLRISWKDHEGGAPAAGATGKLIREGFQNRCVRVCERQTASDRQRLAAAPNDECCVRGQSAGDLRAQPSRRGRVRTLYEAGVHEKIGTWVLTMGVFKPSLVAAVEPFTAPDEVPPAADARDASDWTMLDGTAVAPAVVRAREDTASVVPNRLGTLVVAAMAPRRRSSDVFGCRPASAGGAGDVRRGR